MRALLQFQLKKLTAKNVPKELGAPPPNSLTLLLYFLVAGGAKKVILCGVDGFKDNNINVYETYYNPKIAEEERILAFQGNKSLKGSIPHDSRAFNDQFTNLLELCKKTYNNPDIEILNCSEKSIIHVFRKIRYEDLTKEL